MYVACVCRGEVPPIPSTPLNHTFSPHRLSLEPLLFRIVAAPLAAHKYMYCTRTSLHVSHTPSLCAEPTLYTSIGIILFPFPSPPRFSQSRMYFFATRIFANSIQVLRLKNLEQFFLFPLFSFKIGNTIQNAVQVKLYIQRAIALKYSSKSLVLLLSVHFSCAFRTSFYFIYLLFILFYSANTRLLRLMRRAAAKKKAFCSACILNTGFGFQ